MRGALGLCMRAGKLALGARSVEDATRAGKARLLLADAEASENTRKYARDACEHYGLPYRELPAGMLAGASGKPGRMVAAVTDAGFAERFIKLIDTNID